MDIKKFCFWPLCVFHNGIINLLQKFIMRYSQISQENYINQSYNTKSQKHAVKVQHKKIW